MIEWEPDETIWQQMYDILRERIETGSYKPRMPLPSITHLEQEFGVARGDSPEGSRQVEGRRLSAGDTGQGHVRGAAFGAWERCGRRRLPMSAFEHSVTAPRTPVYLR